jgi:hypothetical protein
MNSTTFKQGQSDFNNDFVQYNNTTSVVQPFYIVPLYNLGLIRLTLFSKKNIQISFPTKIMHINFISV